jgi:hypothetical protein
LIFRLEKGKLCEMPVLRTVLTLSRPAGLPTIWSNCLAGWWLGGGGNPAGACLLLAGATLLYLGGVFLNDAFDADYDLQHRRTRPIPSRQISRKAVLRWGLGWLIGGALLLLWAGKVTGGFGLGLVFFILLYNALHRLVTFSPVLLGICRFSLYVLGASVAERGVTGWAIWCGVALGVYMVGWGYFARWKNRADQAQYWPAFLLAAPILLALLMDADGYRQAALLLSAILGLWGLRCLRQTFWSPDRNLSRTLSGLAAGIVFVDWLAACPVAMAAGQSPTPIRSLSAAFIGLFLATLALQRLAPTN